jgi:hypothetical protein
MTRHPSVIAREQRAMRKARTSGHRSATVAEAVPDARDLEPIQAAPREPCDVMAVTRDGGWRLVAMTETRDQAIFLANLARTRCLVRSRSSGKRVFDNKRESPR